MSRLRFLVTNSSGGSNPSSSEAIRFILFFVCIALMFQGCNIGADSTKKLSGGYFLRNEGGDIKDILCENPNGGEIPSTIIDYDYDKNFIIAKQKPKIPQDPLYNGDYHYKNGIDQNYFWLIIHSKEFVKGPLDMEEFKLARKQYNVPSNLDFK